MGVSSRLSFRSAGERWNHRSNSVGQVSTNHLLVAHIRDLRRLSVGRGDFDSDGRYFEVVQRTQWRDKRANRKSGFLNRSHDLRLGGLTPIHKWSLRGVPVQKGPTAFSCDREHCGENMDSAS